MVKMASAQQQATEVESCNVSLTSSKICMTKKKNPPKPKKNPNPPPACNVFSAQTQQFQRFPRLFMEGIRSLWNTSASEVNILPSSGNKNFPVAEGLLVYLTLKLLSFIFFYVVMTLEYNED